jgi:hypothetical protein
MNTSIAWIIVGCGIAILVTEYIFYLESVRLHRLEKSSNVFYENLDKLLKDKGTPEAAVDLLSFLNDRITEPRTAFILVICGLLRMARPSLARSPKMNESGFNLDEIGNHYKKLGDEFYEPFMMLMVSAIFTATYSSVLFGWIARKLVLPDLNRDRDRAPYIISTIAHDAGRHHDGFAHA